MPSAWMACGATWKPGRAHRYVRESRVVTVRWSESLQLSPLGASRDKLAFTPSLADKGVGRKF
eukprot:2225335-Prymnesium_polylepis.1